MIEKIFNSKYFKIASLITIIFLVISVLQTLSNNIKSEASNTDNKNVNSSGLEETAIPLSKGFTLQQLIDYYPLEVNYKTGRIYGITSINPTYVLELPSTDSYAIEEYRIPSLLLLEDCIKDESEHYWLKTNRGYVNISNIILVELINYEFNSSNNNVFNTATPGYEQGEDDGFSIPDENGASG